MAMIAPCAAWPGSGTSQAAQAMPQAMPKAMLQPAVHGMPVSQVRAPCAAPGAPMSLTGTWQNVAAGTMPSVQARQVLPQQVPYAAGMGGQLPPGMWPQNPSAATPVRLLAGASPDIVFNPGDKVQLRGHAANPDYEGKIYTVEGQDELGVVQVTHKVMENAVSRMCFNAAHLELVTAVGDLPPQEPAVAPETEDALCSGLKVGDTVQISGLGHHDGRLCTVVSADDRQAIMRVKFVDCQDMLELAPSYLTLIEPAKASSVDASVERVGVEGEGGIKVGDQVIILAPPHHKGKVGVVEVPDLGDGSLRVRMQDPSDSVTVLVLSPTHVQNPDGTAVAGTADAVASRQAQADAIRQAAAVPSHAQTAAASAAPLAAAPGDRVRVKQSLPAHAGKVGTVEADNDGSGCCFVLFADDGGATRLRINPVHLDPA
ncbi:unnamed protein product [Symbiodinium sp. CCMP2592]|nr:unnamed protein product [Symbiodinium sp. CCMP2592]